MDLKRVLIITYYFPLRPGIASLRLKGLAKYLPEFGWDPVILTAALPGATDKNFNVIKTTYPGDVLHFLKKLGLNSSKGFQEQIGISLTIREGKKYFSSKLTTLIRGLISYPDEKKYWHPIAVKNGAKIIKEGNFKAIISSSGPVTTHLIARELKRKYNVP